MSAPTPPPANDGTPGMQDDSADYLPKTDSRPTITPPDDITSAAASVSFEPPPFHAFPEYAQEQAVPFQTRVQTLFSQSPSRGYKVKREITHQWTVFPWSKHQISAGRLESEPIHFGDCQWTLVTFPNGSLKDSFVSLFIKLHAIPENIPNFSICVDFVMGILNTSKTEFHEINLSHRKFERVGDDWGFSSLCAVNALLDPRNLLLDNDKATFFLHIREFEDNTGVLFMNLDSKYNPKEVTGYVGLKNQGATCYMNSILQSLFFTNNLRKAIFQIPSGSDSEAVSVTSALQRLFYMMQFRTSAVDTRGLTTSFGWNTIDAFAQHDVQEFLRVLMDKIEEKAKGTPADGTMQELFVGKMKSYVKCVDIPYESSREEDFYDIQLNVKGMRNVYDSFRDYIQVEMLDGDNMYEVEGHGLHAAKKGIKFTNFPPVLHLLLKRFEYDFNVDRMVKINDRFEYPEILDMDEFLEETQAEKAKSFFECSPMQISPPPTDRKTASLRYHLHGVLVHAGSLDGGHYIVFIRPTQEDKWFKFNDDHVLPVPLIEVTEDNYGIAPESAASTGLPAWSRNTRTGRLSSIERRVTNAYMLVYIRESEYDKVLCPVLKEDVPVELRERFEAELQSVEQVEREQRESTYMLKVYILDGQSIKAHTGIDLYGAAPNGWSKKFEMNGTTVGMLRKMYAEHIKVPLEYLRLWCFRLRENRTMRICEWGETEDIPDSVGLLSLRSRLYTTPRSPGVVLFCDVVQPSLKRKSPTTSPMFSEMLSKSNSLENFKDDSTLTSADMVAAQQPCNEQTRDSSSDIVFSYGEISPPLPSVQKLVFVKLFDVLSQVLSVVGHIKLETNDASEIRTKARAICGWPTETPVLLWEEVQPNKIEPIMDGPVANLSSGDIITVQRDDIGAPPGLNNGERIFANAADYYNGLVNTVTVTFRPRGRDDPSSPHVVQSSQADRSATGSPNSGFTLDLLLQAGYDEVCGVVAHALGITDPMLLRFTGTYSSGEPRSTIERSPIVKLSQMLIPFGNYDYNANSRYAYGNVTGSVSGCSAGTLLYEILDVSITEIDAQRKIKLPYTLLGKADEVDVVVPKTGTVGTLIESFGKKLNLSEDELALVRIYECTKHTIRRELRSTDRLKDILAYVEPVAQVIPPHFIGPFKKLKRRENAMALDNNTNNGNNNNFYGGDNDIDNENNNNNDDDDDNEVEVEDDDEDDDQRFAEKPRKFYFIDCVHFEDQPPNTHGVPFRFPLYEGERFAQTLVRLRAYLGYNEGEFEKITFGLFRAASLNGEQIIPITQEQILYDRVFVTVDELELSGLLLGLGHRQKRQNRLSAGRSSLKIFN